MNKEILEFINGIKNNAAIGLSVYTESGQAVVADNVNSPIVLPLFDSVFVDKEKAKTFFRFKFNGASFVAVLEGAGELEKSYAFLIGELAKKSGKEELSKEKFISLLVTGDADASFIKKNAKRFGLKDKPLFATIIKIESGERNYLTDFLTSYAEAGDFYYEVDESKMLFVKVCDQTIADYSSCAEYAELLCRSVFEETAVRVKIGVGGIVDGLEKLNVSYSQALSTVDMMEVLQNSGDVHTYKEYVLIKILGDLPKTKINSYLSLLQDANTKEIFEDQEIIDTAEFFLDNNLNASETSRKMFLHRNTLTYRLDKIEKATGLNIRKFADAVTFRLITILSRLTR